MHIYVQSPYSWCIDLSNHTQSLAKRLVIKALQISWVFHDFTSLKEFAHDTWAANEVSHRCEVKKNATHVPLPCCWHRFDPSAGRRAGVDGGVVPMNANKLCLQRRNHSSKVTLNSYTNNMSRLKSRPEDYFPKQKVIFTLRHTVLKKTTTNKSFHSTKSWKHERCMVELRMSEPLEKVTKQTFCNALLPLNFIHSYPSMQASTLSHPFK